MAVGVGVDVAVCPLTTVLVSGVEVGVGVPVGLAVGVANDEFRTGLDVGNTGVAVMMICTVGLGGGPGNVATAVKVGGRVGIPGGGGGVGCGVNVAVGAKLGIAAPTVGVTSVS